MHPGVFSSVSHKAARILCWLLCFATAEAAARTTTFPPPFYTLKTEGERAAYLTRIIKDSVTAGAYTQVPGWCHIALGFAKSLGPNDTLSPKLYRALGDAYETTQADSAAIYYRYALSTIRNPTITQRLYLEQSLAYAFMATENRDSIRYYTKALERTIAALPDTSHAKLKAANTIASGYNALSQYEAAVRTYGYVIRQSQAVKDSVSLRNALVNAGNVYHEMGNARMAIYNTLQAIPYVGADPYAEMVVYANLAGYYQYLNIADSATFFVTKAEALAAASGDEASLYSVRIQKAGVLLLSKKWSAAEALLARSLAYFIPQGPSTDLVNTLLVYAALDTFTQNYQQAEAHLKTLYTVSADMPRGFRAEALRMLVAVEEKLGNYKAAFGYGKELAAYNDSVATAAVQNSLAELQTEYGTYKKDEEIKTLQQAARIRELQIATARREKALAIVGGAALLAGLLVVLYIRSLRSKTALQNLKAELEMKALRSQMNPHFIFNSLASIQKYIWENRREDASEYLTKFARLIRLVLENSMHRSVPLSEELAALRLYIEMEHRRAGGGFDYTITVAETVDEEGTAIPPLLLQPYVENAIWHGLSPKEGRGKLSIAVDRHDGALLCTIDDDGVGRAQAAGTKTAGFPKKSLAMNISSQRIAGLRQETGRPAGVSITDKQHNGQALGTAVLLNLPLIKVHA